MEYLAADARHRGIRYTALFQCTSCVCSCCSRNLRDLGHLFSIAPAIDVVHPFACDSSLDLRSCACVCVCECATQSRGPVYSLLDCHLRRPDTLAHRLACPCSPKVGLGPRHTCHLELKLGYSLYNWMHRVRVTSRMARRDIIRDRLLRPGHMPGRHDSLACVHACMHECPTARGDRHLASAHSGTSPSVRSQGSHPCPEQGRIGPVQGWLAGWLVISRRTFESAKRRQVPSCRQARTPSAGERAT